MLKYEVRSKLSGGVIYLYPLPGENLSQMHLITSLSTSDQRSIAEKEQWVRVLSVKYRSGIGGVGQLYPG